MKTVAIDFETANEDRKSACAIGLAWIEGGCVTRREYRLIRPKEMRFNWHNIRVHGIEPEDVLDAPEFPEVISEFLLDIKGALIIAHNAAFDVGVLCSSLADYGQSIPEFKFCCTMAMSRSVWPRLPHFTLDAVARHCGIGFRHHHAGDDAMACAQIALAAAQVVGASDIISLSREISLEPRVVEAKAYAPIVLAKGYGSVKSRSVARKESKNETESPLLFRVLGSSGNSYEVGVSKVGNYFKMTCTCKAGQMGRWCKHRTWLLDGEADYLLSENGSDMAKLAEMARTLHLDR